MLTADHQITNGKGFCIMNNKGLIKEIFVMTLADAITAIAVFFFLVPSHTSISSISGLGIILTHFIPLPLSVITMALNILLLIIGFIFCGKEFGAKTVYTSVMLPVFLGIFEKIFPDFTSLTGSQELDAICYVLVVSIGLAMLFNMNASSGGLDIVAKIMNKYLHVDLGKAMSLSGMCVALSSAFVYDKKTVVLSVLGTYVNGIVLDYFIFDQNVKRRVCIITKKEEELREFIINNLHSGATIYEAIGAYNFEKHNEIITIVDKREYQALMNYISSSDPEAFITVYKVSAEEDQCVIESALFLALDTSIVCFFRFPSSRSALKKSFSICEHSSPNSPTSVSTWWLNPSSWSMSSTDPAQPAFGFMQPITTFGILA